MRRSLSLGSATLIGRVIALGMALTISLQAQEPDSDYEVPRNEFDQPDIGGFWTNETLTPMVRPEEYGDRLIHTSEEVAEIEGDAETLAEERNRPTDPDAGAEFENETTVTRGEFESAGGDVGGYNYFWLDPGDRLMRVDGEPRTSLITTPNGRPPARKEDAPPRPQSTRGKREEFPASYETRSLGERCIIGFGRNSGPPMFPNGFYNNNYHIVQAPDHVMILVEMNHDARIIPLKEKAPADDDVRNWFGDSVGWYEGDTLVVETTDFREDQDFFGAWKNLKITERFTRVGENRLHYEFTAEDPTVWDEPWGGEYEFAPLDGVIYEYACHEGNYALPGILQGNLMDEDE